MQTLKTTGLDFLLLLGRWKKWLFLNALAVGIVSAVVSLFLPKWYCATTVLAPPQQDLGMLAGFSQMLSSMPMGRALGIGGMSEQAGLYLTLLNSRTLMEAVSDEFDLKTLYRKRNREETVKALRKNVVFGLEDEGALSIQVLDKSPQRAADMANRFVRILDSLNIQLTILRARNNRIFIEKRLQQNRDDMDRAETEMKLFQQANNIISLEEQTAATVMVAAELQAQMLAYQYEQNAAKGIYGESHSEVLRLGEQISSIEKELRKMRYGDSLSDKRLILRDKTGGEVFMPLFKIPDLGQRYLKLFKEVQVQNKLYTFLVQQYEQAKIQEMKDTPTVQIIDKAVAPIRKAKPKRAIVVLSSVFSCSLAFVLVLFWREHYRLLETNDPVRFKKVQQVFRSFRR
jgi:tyrosine-protein kinase Etk/Wzc